MKRHDLLLWRPRHSLWVRRRDERTFGVGEEVVEVRCRTVVDEQYDGGSRREGGGEVKGGVAAAGCEGAKGVKGAAANIQRERAAC